MTILLAIMALPVGAQQRFDIAVISDGPSGRLTARNGVYVGELQTLTEDEFDVRIHSYTGNWNHQSIAAVIEDAYASPQIDMLMVTGFIANQIATTRKEFPKPTFLPVLLDTGRLIASPVDRKSAITNLNYLTVYSDFADDLDAMGELVQFDNLVLLMDEEFFAAIPDLRAAALALCDCKRYRPP